MRTRRGNSNGLILGTIVCRYFPVQTRSWSNTIISLLPCPHDTKMRIPVYAKVQYITLQRYTMNVRCKDVHCPSLLAGHEPSRDKRPSQVHRRKRSVDCVGTQYRSETSETISNFFKGYRSAFFTTEWLYQSWDMTQRIYLTLWLKATQKKTTTALKHSAWISNIRRSFLRGSLPNQRLHCKHQPERWMGLLSLAKKSSITVRC